MLSSKYPAFVRALQVEVLTYRGKRDITECFSLSEAECHSREETCMWKTKAGDQTSYCRPTSFTGGVKSAVSKINWLEKAILAFELTPEEQENLRKSVVNPKDHNEVFTQLRDIALTKRKAMETERNMSHLLGRYEEMLTHEGFDKIGLVLAEILKMKGVFKFNYKVAELSFNPDVLIKKLTEYTTQKKFKAPVTDLLAYIGRFNKFHLKVETSDEERDDTRFSLTSVRVRKFTFTVGNRSESDKFDENQPIKFGENVLSLVFNRDSNDSRAEVLFQ